MHVVHALALSPVFPIFACAEKIRETGDDVIHALAPLIYTLEDITSLTLSSLSHSLNNSVKDSVDFKLY